MMHHFDRIAALKPGEAYPADILPPASALSFGGVMGLAEQLAAAQSEVDRVKRAIAHATCREIGAHDWKSIGGCNAGCCEDCGCSVPVHVCARCGDCDYGDNDEAENIRGRCNEGR